MSIYLREEWREIPGFPGYEASTLGFIRTYWYKVRNSTGYGTHRELRDIPKPLPGSPDDNGYLHVNVYCALDGIRYTRKIHVLIAITFLPLPDDYEFADYTVDHIDSGPRGKLNNAVTNLQWMTRSDNIKKAYADGVCDVRIRKQCKPIMVRDLWTGEWTYYDSITDAAHCLNLDHSTLSHAINNGRNKVSHHIIEYAGREDRLLYGNEYYDYETGRYY